ncbi:MAG: hypothetical protein ACJ757_03990 [Gaiellaceae bacterium]
MPEDTTVPSGGRTANEFRDIADALRNRVDLFGKSLGAIATFGITAVGLGKIGDLFPVKDDKWWVVAACAGLIIAAVAAIGIAVRLMLVARPVFMQADVDNNNELDNEGERAAVRPVFAASAKRFGYTTLLGLQERELSLRNAASRTIDKDERTRRTALADEVKVEIEQALARAQVVVVRLRATEAVRGRAWLLYVVIIGGLMMFAVGANKASSDRKAPIANAKACGEARKAGATAAELGRATGVCDGEAAKAAAKPKPPSAVEARAQITASLAETLKACAALVAKQGDPTSGPLSNADCAPVRQAVAAMP